MDKFPLTESIISELVRRVTDAQELMLKYEIEANTVVLNNRKYAALIDKLKWYPTICGLKAEVAPLMDDVDFIVQRRPQTNADRIRAMSDEELAEFGSKRMCCLPGKPGCGKNNLTCDSCYQCWLDWLKEEAQCTSE